MSRFVSVVCNDDSLVSTAVRALRDQVVLPTNGDAIGHGVGWIQGDQTLLRTTPKPSPSAPGLFDVLVDIRARGLVGHVLSMTEVDDDITQLQPYRFRRWILAHSGEQPEERALRSLLAEVPEFVASNVKNITAGEVFSHMFLGELHRRGILDAGSPALYADALAALVRAVQVEAAVADFALVAISAKTLVTASVGHPVHAQLLRGLQTQPEPLFAGHRPRAVNHGAFKGVVLTDAAVTGDGWAELDDEHVSWLDDGWQLRSRTIHT